MNMEFKELIERRYSVRAYKSDEIEQEKIDKILQAGVLAPTACNNQAFKIIVIRTKGREEELRGIYKAKWFTKAPIVLGVCSIPGNTWVRFDGKNYSDVDATIVMDHIILAATDLGLGTCWIGAFDTKAAKSVLGLDDSLEPVAFTPLGYADSDQPTKSRKAVEELVIYR